MIPHTSTSTTLRLRVHVLRYGEARSRSEPDSDAGGSTHNDHVRVHNHLPRDRTRGACAPCGFQQRPHSGARGAPAPHPDCEHNCSTNVLNVCEPIHGLMKFGHHDHAMRWIVCAGNRRQQPKRRSQVGGGGGPPLGACPRHASREGGKAPHADRAPLPDGSPPASPHPLRARARTWGPTRASCARASLGGARRVRATLQQAARSPGGERRRLPLDGRRRSLRLQRLDPKVVIDLDRIGRGRRQLAR
mmetsp:Transcript_57358/g.152775  ORF Transcript_57358/g.152775 Transcript_57358/m.152775 type:complete len:247 (+) Transcript_57358:29-769(+)